MYLSYVSCSAVNSLVPVYNVSVFDTRAGSFTQQPATRPIGSVDDPIIVEFPIPAKIADPLRFEVDNSIYLPIEVKHSSENVLLRVMGTADTACGVISASEKVAQELGLEYKACGDMIQTADGKLQPRLVATKPVIIYHGWYAISYNLTEI